MSESTGTVYEDAALPREPIDVIVDPFRRFLHIQASSGLVLLAATAVALFMANSSSASGFLAFWQTKVGFSFGAFEMKHSLQHWINDFLMSVFFFVIGLEVKRELVLGELRGLKRAALPVAAALGGMVVPAGIYLALQAGEPGASGWGIPMATDIAFVVGCLAVLGARIPNSLRVMLLSLAIVDDIGAILIIAIGYTDAVNFTALALGLAGIAVFLGLARLGVRNSAVYAGVALLVWFGFHESGVHATIAGVIIGLMLPTKAWVSESRLGKIVQNTLGFLQGGQWPSQKERYTLLRQMERAARKAISPVERFETDLHPWVGFLIMPLFALANAGVPIEASAIAHPVAVAVILGLVVGKPLGVVLFSFLAVKAGFARLPEGVSWLALLGGGALAGIGFTMALFISGLALGEELSQAAKLGILVASGLSAVVGMSLLLFFLPKAEQASDDAR